MEIDRGDICRYLDFLRDEPGYCITLHGEPAEWPEFVRYNFHPNPYCHYVKTVCECWSECIARQRKVTAACRDGAFFRDLLCRGGRVCVSVDGGRGADRVFVGQRIFGARRIDGTRKGCAFCAAVPCACGGDWPDADKVSAACAAAGDGGRRSSAAVPYACGVRAAAENLPARRRPVHAGAAVYHRAPSRTADDAEWLLEQSEISVTEISDSLGFCSPAYFSTVFKKAYGVSPHGRTRRAHGEPAHK